MSVLKSNLGQRVVTALVVLPIVLALIWLPAFVPNCAWEPLPRLGFAVLVAAVAMMALHEFYKLLRAREIPTSEPAAQLGALIIILAAWLGDTTFVNAALVAAVVASCFANVTFAPPSAAGICGAIAGLVYTVWCPAHVLLVHQYWDGSAYVMLLAVVVVLTDTAAYFVGKAIGKHPLAPIVSPKKTWEGALGGLIVAVIGATVYGKLSNMAVFDDYDWPLWRYAMTGAVLSVVAQLSDLVKSSVKRDAGVKDSGQILPGHGGALDRFDGFLFAAPVLYYMTVI